MSYPADPHAAPDYVWRGKTCSDCLAVWAKRENQLLDEIRSLRWTNAQQLRKIESFERRIEELHDLAFRATR